ncbi:hypothetical protein BT96DRAFT_917105 [Gymnopus androsaceus JB14]|uniref:Uncharacterized protein n=1 Tax=Gymnopus androsaceus JB14 TaxID=1447944 RepID=A0A6A4I5V2_9AGAR|nr:hypothetical protein BT96DRAFT_917105 [Gymnopus androsaceus JB14]
MKCLTASTSIVAFAILISFASHSSAAAIPSSSFSFDARYVPPSSDLEARRWHELANKIMGGKTPSEKTPEMPEKASSNSGTAASFKSSLNHHISGLSSSFHSFLDSDDSVGATTTSKKSKFDAMSVATNHYKGVPGF